MQWGCYDSYDGFMQTLSRIGVATAMALVAFFVGGGIGFLTTWVIVQHTEIVEGPPATVLLVLVVGIFALAGAVLGFLLSFRWLGHRGTQAR